MTTNHIISDFVARINNALQKNKKTVLVPKTNKIKNLLNVMEQEGFIVGYQDKVEDKKFNVFLKYFQDKPVINNFSSISKPSRRVYFSKKDIRNGKPKNSTLTFLFIH